MKKFKTLLSIESNELKFDLRMKLTILILIVSLAQINAKTYSLNFNNSFEIEKGDDQQTTVTGKVTDESGVPLPGASIQVKGTSTGSATDFDGVYSITVPDGSTTLVFSYLGFITQEVSINGQTTLNVTLSEDNTSLDEVVVVGYGTQRKSDVVGAISQVKGEDLILSSTVSVNQALQGRAAGVQITQNSAQPGGGLDIAIRGQASINASNEPLYVVDGFPLSSFNSPDDGNRYDGGTQGALNFINPNDIESIEVLKDASSTAIYGSRAANGVVLITTKKGKSGKLTVDYSTTFSFQEYDNDFEVLEAQEYMQLRNDAAYERWTFLNRVEPYASGNNPSRTLEAAIADPSAGVAFERFYSDDEINNAPVGTNWFDLVTRTGLMQQHNLSLRGGSKSTSFFISGNIFEHKGVVKNSAFERVSFRSNINHKFNDKLNFGINLSYNTINNDYVPLGGQAYENSGLIRSALQYSPLVEAIDEFGNYPINTDNATTPNPYSLLTITDQGEISRALANAFLEYKPIEGLTLRAQAGIDIGRNKRNSYLPTTTLYGAADNGRATISSTEQKDKLLDLTANYKVTLLEDHRLDFLAGFSYQTFDESSVTAVNTNFLTDAFLWNNLGGASEQLISNSGRETNEIASFFGRFSYVYKDRYMLTSTIRRDGSGRFSPNKKFATFPSIALGWNIAKEPFMNNIKDVVSQFKLRVGYGQTGNADFEDNWNSALESYAAYLGPDGETDLIGFFPSRLENPDLKWETTTETNIGLDFGFFKNRISGSVEMFNREISDLIDERSLISFHEINTVVANVGTTQSKGLEVTLNTTNIKTKNFTWKSTLTYSTYDDRWKERNPEWVPSVYQSVDDPIRARYSYLSDGIMQAGEVVPAQPDLFPGQIKIKDVNGFVRDGSGNPVVDENGFFQRTGEPDGQIDVADNVLLGSTDPDFLAGFSNTFTYKNLSLNLHFNGMFGRQIIDETDLAYGMQIDHVTGNNSLISVRDRWTPDNPSTTRPGSHFGYSDYGVGDFFLQDAWFIRLNNVSLAYQFPQKWLGKTFSRASIRLDGQNLFIITPFTGGDPETNGYDESVDYEGNTGGGSVNNTVAAYPNVRTFSVGLDLQF